jgi:flagellar biogenesis protein FliO
VSRRRYILPAAFFLHGQYATWGQAVSPSPSASPFPASYPTPYPPPFPAHTSDGMLQIIVYFVLITALLIAGLYFTRTGFNGLLRKGKGEKKLIISEARTLGNRQFLVVAEYENRKMLLGVCPGRIDYLSTLSGGGDETFSTDLQDKE